MGDEAERMYLMEIEQMAEDDVREYQLMQEKGMETLVGIVCDAIKDSIIANFDCSVWTMRNGTKIKVSDMTDLHLNNTINMLYRQKDNPIAIKYADRMQLELVERRHGIRAIKPKNKGGNNTMGVANVKLKVVGVKFDNPDGTNRQSIIGTLQDNSPVFLQREPHNQYDTNAVAVFSLNGQIGYIGKDYSSIIAPMMDQGKKFDVKIAEVGEYKSTNYISIVLNEVV